MVRDGQPKQGFAGEALQLTLVPRSGFRAHLKPSVGPLISIRYTTHKRDAPEMPLHHHQVVINRFVAACQTDERVVAATLYGSCARGAADAYSDLDLGLLTTDEAYEDFLAGRAAFVRTLGEPVFLEDFDLSNIVFFILSDGTEVELSF